MSLYDDLQVEIQLLVDAYKLRAADGLSIGEAWTLLVQATGSLVKLAETSNGNGVDKKLLVIAAVEKLYDEVIAPLDIPGVPNFLEKTVVDPVVGKMVPVIVSALIDGLVELLVKDD